ncbi:Choline/ethanolamine kinase family protein [Babesia bovis T2Bo]|uniref:ethanolamine kinase n=1 Tax=Babesia bovis TaxID=5865 RepID=A7ARL7_BABBO|nr:Choline/ethanolamine kinase family protein [Babesia bovis T2Bo]EDO07186.1 Choline/ethanolamine kinase family protein [Babesia bovis T2Bo]|eukprot:XP_001610754.1 choline/ethanolamine kinase [Babesia bovis T2Bo]
MVDSKAVKNIAEFLGATQPTFPQSEKTELEPLSHEEIIAHAVRLGHKQLGINVEGLDLSGDLDINQFSYLEKVLIVGGWTNILYKVTNRDNGNIVAVRIFGRQTERFIDRSHERIIQNHLCLQGFAKHVYARFNGGQIEEWLPGNVVSDDDFYSFKYTELIAKQLYKLHATPGQRDLYVKLYPHLAKNGELKFESQLWASVWKFYDLCLENIQQVEPIIGDNFNLRDIRKVIKRLEVVCAAKKSPVVLTHCDLLNGNVLVSENEDHVIFLDYEYSCFMERGFDIANHFIEYCGVECNWDRIPNEEEQRRFIKYYIGENATEKAIEKLYNEIQPFFMAANIFWGLWGLLQCIYSTHDIDFKRYANFRIERAINDHRWMLL